MKNFIKTATVTAAGTVFLFALAIPANAQVTSDSATVDVTANVVVAFPLSITAPASIDFGEINIPVQAANTCAYNNTRLDGSYVGGATGSVPNPEPTNCVVSTQPTLPEATVTCAPDSAITFTQTITQNAAAQAAGLDMKLVAADFGDKTLILDEDGVLSFDTTCSQTGTSEFGFPFSLLVPGTAQPYNGSVGEITVDVV